MSGVTSGRASREVGPSQSAVHQGNRMELDLPLSNKEIPLSDNGAPISDASRQLDHSVNVDLTRNAAKQAALQYEQKYQRNALSINGSISGKESSMITSQREAYRGKEAFPSPYVNIGNRSSNPGAYVTPNRQVEYGTRLYASGGEATALHGGDADLSSFMRLNQSNNTGSYN